MRIVFMGTPAFATASLKALLEAEMNVVAVVTAPDKTAGRGRKLRQSDVKDFALAHNLPVLQPTNLKSDDFIEELKSLAPDLALVVAFRMLPKVVWQMPDHGTINLHASLLPKYRGAAPINWAIINGDKRTGVTSFFINENIDTGDLIMQAEMAIAEDDDAGSLHDKLMKLGADILVRTVRAITKDKAPRIPQDPSASVSLAPKIFKEDTRIDWNQPQRVVYDFIRGLSPYPSATTFLNQEQPEFGFKIYKTRISHESIKTTAGEIKVIDGKKLLVAVKDGWLEILELQSAGKKRMTSSDFLNGTMLESGAKFL